MLRYSLVLLGLIPLALGYSSGAPTFPGVCRNLIPGHGEAPQEGTYFSITAPSTAARTSSVNLILGGDRIFKGFLVRAFKSVLHENGVYEISDEGLGQFQVTPNVQITTCDNADDTATHKKNQYGVLEEKQQVNLTWTAPDFATRVAFRSTVCVNYTTIYLNNAKDMDIL